MVEEDCDLLNIVKPERFILTNFLVPPVCIRPSVVMGGGGGRFFFYNFSLLFFFISYFILWSKIIY